MFFFDDDDLVPRKRSQLKALPLTPDTGWLPPADFPNLSGASVIAIDTETKESDFEHGPGWSRGKSHIVGFSLAAEDNDGNRGSWYFPIRHEVEPEYNMNVDRALSWLKHTVETPYIPKVFANAIYDIGTLTDENIFVEGQIHDVQVAEALIDETANVALEDLGNKYLGTGKESQLLYKWCADAYGGEVNGKQRANIYRTSPRLVGPYAQGDVDLPLDVLKAQWSILRYEELLELYRMECDLLPLLIQMRQQGVRVDIEGAEQLSNEITATVVDLYKKLAHDFGCNVDSVNSGTQLAALFDYNNIKYPRTPTGKPSFKKEWMDSLEGPLGKAINEIRMYEKVKGTFLDSYVLGNSVNGIIHCQFHSLRGEKNGAKTGRFASSDPNLQNIPVRTAVGKKVRKLFISHLGHSHIRKSDYSQIEYRMLANFAVGTGSDELRQSYITNPKTDYHDVVQGNVKLLTGLIIDRKPIKNINFGLLYGQSEKGLAYKAGFTSAQAKDIFSAYHTGAPYVKPTMESIAQEVQDFGYVRTILNRRTRFNQWEAVEYKKNEDGVYELPMSYETAIRKYGANIRRAFAYRGVNYKLQGSAAEVIKVAMLACFKAGLFHVTGMPLLQVHDELVFSVKDSSKEQIEAYEYMEYLLENSLPCKVPIKIESGNGPNWGSIE